MRKQEIILGLQAVEPFMKNGYIVACPETRHAIYIDPGDEAPQLLEWLAQKELELKAVFNTHGHLDHVCGNRTVKERYDVPIFLHQEDEFIYEALSDQAAWFGLNYPPGPPVDRYFTDRERLPVCLLYTSPSPRDLSTSRMPSSA